MPRWQSAGVCAKWTDVFGGFPHCSVTHLYSEYFMQIPSSVIGLVHSWSCCWKLLGKARSGKQLREAEVGQFCAPENLCCVASLSLEWIRWAQWMTQCTGSPVTECPCSHWLWVFCLCSFLMILFLDPLLLGISQNSLTDQRKVVEDGSDIIIVQFLTCFAPF